MSEKKRARNERTLEKQLEIVKYADQHTGMKKKDIAAHFGLSPQTLGDILKNSEKIRAACSDGDALMNSKRQRPTHYPEVDKALHIWFRQKSCHPELRLDGAMLLHQANKFLRLLLPESTQEIAPAWIDRFKRRYGVSRWRIRRRRCGSCATVERGQTSRASADISPP